MVFEVVAACIHMVENTDINTRSLYGRRDSKPWLPEKINSVVRGAPHGGRGAVGSRCADVFL